jgi:hypothetical protein
MEFLVVVKKFEGLAPKVEDTDFRKKYMDVWTMQANNTAGVEFRK